MAKTENRGGFNAVRGSARSSACSTASEFERLYRENYTLVYNFVNYRMAGSRDAEDVVAEAFMKAAKAFVRFDPRRAKFSTWVISIARNCMNDHWAKQRVTSTLDDIPDHVTAIEDDYPALDENAELVRTLLASIDETDRELVFMKDYEGKKNVEIARELDLNASTISTRLHRALAKMRTVAERGH